MLLKAHIFRFGGKNNTHKAVAVYKWLELLGKIGVVPPNTFDLLEGFETVSKSLITSLFAGPPNTFDLLEGFETTGD